MKKLFILSGIFLLIGILELMSCSKEDEKTASPTIAFYDETGFISQDTVAKYNDTLRFKVYSIYNGTDKLEKFVVRMNGYLFIDSAINASSFSIDIVANKTIEDVEVWKFETTDNAGHKTDFEITITGLFGPIKSYKDILLGAQDNPSIESFVSYSNDTVTKYFQTAAYIHQAAIDMFCFYEDIPDHQNFMTLAAPGSNISGIFTGMTSPENYSIKNTTYFVLTTLSVLEFESIENDARVIDAFVTGNKILMANQLNPEDIYAFLLESGKYGLLKVTAVEGAEAGTLKFDVKIQE
jgi:hypothetical protein